MTLTKEISGEILKEFVVNLSIKLINSSGSNVKSKASVSMLAVDVVYLATSFC